MEPVFIVLGVLALLGAAGGTAIYLTTQYEHSLRGQEEWWKNRRSSMQMWLTHDRGAKLPPHLERLRSGLRQLLEQVPPWPSADDEVSSKASGMDDDEEIFGTGSKKTKPARP